MSLSADVSNNGSVVLFISERFFDMKKAQCKEVIDAYRKFLTRQEGVAKFLKQAEVRVVGWAGNIPYLWGFFVRNRK